jgi:hypothetical protein
MTDQVRGGERNLTGVWNGLYTYPNGKSTSFVATLIENGGSVTGTTHEPGLLGKTAFATLTGSRLQSAVAFTKTYDRPGLFYRNPVVYEGTLNSEGTEIEGRWTIRRILSGKFLMVRSPRQEAKAERKAFART